MASDDERWDAFVEGVQLVFKSWTALQLAIENSWGGHDSEQKAEEFVEDILYWFTLCNKDPDVFALHDQLMAGLLEDFNTEAEDGSLHEVAQSLIDLYHECKNGTFTKLVHLRETAESLLSTTATKAMDCDVSSSESEADSAEEMTDASPLREGIAPKEQPKMDSDGFTVVCHRRRK